MNASLKEFHINALQTIRKEPNRQLVLGVLDALRLLMFNCAPHMRANMELYGKSSEAVCSLVHDIFQHQVHCQKLFNEDEFASEGEAQCHKQLKEYAGDVVPSLALCLPGDKFAPFFEQTMRYWLATFAKADTSLVEKSFLIGVIGETIGNMDAITANVAQSLFNGKQQKNSKNWFRISQFFY